MRRRAVRGQGGNHPTLVGVATAERRGTITFAFGLGLKSTLSGEWVPRTVSG